MKQQHVSEELFSQEQDNEEERIDIPQSKKKKKEKKKYYVLDLCLATIQKIHARGWYDLQLTLVYVTLYDWLNVT